MTKATRPMQMVLGWGVRRKALQWCWALKVPSSWALWLKKEKNQGREGAVCFILRGMQPYFSTDSHFFRDLLIATSLSKLLTTELLGRNCDKCINCVLLIFVDILHVSHAFETPFSNCHYSTHSWIVRTKEVNEAVSWPLSPILFKALHGVPCLPSSVSLFVLIPHWICKTRNE